VTTEGVTQSVRLLAGRYQVGELLGRGGMADVHVGIDSRLGRRVAIKLLKPALATNPSFRTRFRREAQEAAKMAHPTIVRIFDAGEETVVDDTGVEVQLPFIIMEFVDGRMLKDMIAEGPIDPVEAVRITSQVLTALEYSHRAGVVHRDVKPGNIMVTTTGQVKVMDFGIARAISDSSASIAETSTIIGTAQYFSPEQARGEAVDARTDLYSTGIVLFEMLTGRAPFVGENPVAVAYQHVNQQPLPPSAFTPRVSPALDAVVLRAMSKDRFERFQTAREFRIDVEAAGAGAIPPRKPTQGGDFNSTLFGVNPAATAGSEATFRQLNVDQNDRIPRTQNRPPVAWIWGGIAVTIVMVVAVVMWTLSLSQTTFTQNVAIDVPDIVGLTYEEGAGAIADAKLVASRVDETNAEFAVGTIIRTDPAAGITVGPGQEISVFVSSGGKQVKVPQIVGATQADASAALAAAGLLEGAITQEYSATVKAGVVISAAPGPGEAAAEGSPVAMVISNGLVQVPSVVGQPIGAATNALTAMQLEVKTVSDMGCGGGAVSAQSATGDAPQQSAITLTYCAKP
jgi:serine/threonine protein kinase/beta-lactam-binding protein with PASTA domain